METLNLRFGSLELTFTNDSEAVATVPKAPSVPSEPKARPVRPSKARKALAPKVKSPKAAAELTSKDIGHSKSVTPPARLPKGAKATLAEVRRLTAEGSFDEAAKLCPESWTQELRSIVKKARAAKPTKSAPVKPKAAVKATPKPKASKGRRQRTAKPKGSVAAAKAAEGSSELTAPPKAVAEGKSAARKAKATKSPNPTPAARTPKVSAPKPKRSTKSKRVTAPTKSEKAAAITTEGRQSTIDARNRATLAVAKAKAVITEGDADAIAECFVQLTEGVEALDLALDAATDEVRRADLQIMANGFAEAAQLCADAEGIKA